MSRHCRCTGGKCREPNEDLALLIEQLKRVLVIELAIV